MKSMRKEVKKDRLRCLNRERVMYILVGWGHGGPGGGMGGRRLCIDGCRHFAYLNRHAVLT